MKFCRQCGKELGEDFNICPYCGTNVNAARPPVYQPSQNQQAWSGSKPGVSVGAMKAIGFALGFFGGTMWLCLVVALVVYLVLRDDKPAEAKAFGKFTLIGMGVSIVVVILFVLLLFLVLSHAPYDGLDVIESYYYSI